MASPRYQEYLHAKDFKPTNGQGQRWLHFCDGIPKSIKSIFVPCILMPRTSSPPKDWVKYDSSFLSLRIVSNEERHWKCDNSVGVFCVFVSLSCLVFCIRIAFALLIFGSPFSETVTLWWTPTGPLRRLQHKAASPWRDQRCSSCSGWPCQRHPCLS